MSFATIFRHSHTNPVRGKELDTNLDYLGKYVDDTFLPLAGGTISWSGTIAGTWDGWIGANETWTYASATTFTVGSDVTGKYNTGDKLKLTQTGTKYFYVVSASYSSPNTTITVTGGSDYSIANAAITSPYYSKFENPNGFPTYFNWTPGFTGFSSDPSVNYARFKMEGKTLTVYADLNPGTSNSTSFTVTGLPVSIVTGDSNSWRPFAGADNSAALNAPVWGRVNTTILTMCKTINSTTSWTASNLKAVYGFVLQYNIQ